LGRARVLPVLQGSGQGALPLAIGSGRHRAPDIGAIGDALGRHRLASTIMVSTTSSNRMNMNDSIDFNLV
jgi:hypothetical protein